MLQFPNCKINIGLNILRKREDGYHDLATVFYPIPLHDNLEIKRLSEQEEPYRLLLSGNKIEGNPESNLIVRVYNDLKQEFNLPPLDIHLYKRIPTGAGLGGGSSDAAYMIKMLNEEFSLGFTNEEMEHRIAPYGADCAFFVREQPAFATGIGDQLTPINLSLKGYHLLLVKPDDFVSTKEAYAGVVPQAPEHDLMTAIQAPIETWRTTIVNDFERSVFVSHPRIAAIKQTLYDMGAIYAAMSGSGSTVFGIFKSEPMEYEEVFKDCFTFHTAHLV